MPIPIWCVVAHWLGFCFTWRGGHGIFRFRFGLAKIDNGLSNLVNSRSHNIQATG